MLGKCLFSALVAVIMVCSIGASEIFRVNPFNYNRFGAEVLGTDVQNLSAHEFDEIHKALLLHKVIVIRNQSNLTIEGQREFTKRFGHLHVHLESSSHYPGYSDVNVVSNIKNAAGNYIGLYGAHVENFHSDLSWTQLPTKLTVVKVDVRPEGCGDTLFADTHAAYDALSPEIKAEVDGKLGNYCYLKLRAVDSTTDSADNLDTNEVRAAKGCARHPLITVHPITSKKNLYANPSHTASVVNMSGARSDELLQLLFAHTAKDEFSYRHVYKDHDLLIWDNRAVHHRATGCPDTLPRKLIRTTVSNDGEPSNKVPEGFGGNGDGETIITSAQLESDRVNAEINHYFRVEEL